MEELAKGCEYRPFAYPESCKPSTSLDFFLIKGNPNVEFRADLSRLEEVVGAVVMIVGAWVQLVNNEGEIVGSIQLTRRNRRHWGSVRLILGVSGRKLRIGSMAKSHHAEAVSFGP